MRTMSSRGVLLLSETREVLSTPLPHGCLLQQLSPAGCGSARSNMEALNSPHRAVQQVQEGILKGDWSNVDLMGIVLASTSQEQVEGRIEDFMITEDDIRSIQMMHAGLDRVSRLVVSVVSREGAVESS